ncbi:ABC-type spermidine/putrescine transport system permease subunit I [Mesorhizobium sp. YL-MeA3-2017]|uniref:ABC transporter permease n=1 Tax=Mesorhizobium TaxID=68287 RepID=UPI000824B6D0|nr:MULTISPECIES: ABC transporter permease [Mesorhizobium]MBN9235864.1 ABC transporter permease [Mesorhizobium sp.]MDQ0333037.1 ABC-type spermidine/putrescine transport system permease subunit I [Mesorhizobium sp. YL-MeA3-2017]
MRGISSSKSAIPKASVLPQLIPWILISPALAIVILVFGRTMFSVIRMSFNDWVPPKFYIDGFVATHYAHLVTDPVIREAVWNTFVLSVVASVASVVLAYVLALIVWLKPAKWRLAIIGMMLCPLLISEISIIFGWWLFLPRNGLLSYALVSTGLLHEKISLLYTEGAAFIGLIYVILPFSFFILLSVMDRQDKQLLEASSDLGASPLITFREVLLPLTWRGIVLALSQAFIWAMGIYATPSALGPDTLWTVGQLIQEQMIGRSNWPMASAMAVAMVFAVLLLMIGARLLGGKEPGRG